MNQIDLLHSFAEFFSINLPEDAALDSRNTLDAFLGHSKQGLPFMIEEAANALAYRKGAWKYIKYHITKNRPNPPMPELFNLKQDLSESYNLVKEFPDIAAKMRAELISIAQSEGIRKQ